MDYDANYFINSLNNILRHTITVPNFDFYSDTMPKSLIDYYKNVNSIDINCGEITVYGAENITVKNDRILIAYDNGGRMWYTIKDGKDNPKVEYSFDGFTFLPSHESFTDFITSVAYLNFLTNSKYRSQFSKIPIKKIDDLKSEYNNLNSKVICGISKTEYRFYGKNDVLVAIKFDGDNLFASYCSYDVERYKHADEFFKMYILPEYSGTSIEWALVFNHSYDEIKTAAKRFYNENIASLFPIFTYYEIDNKNNLAFILFSSKTYGLDFVNRLSKWLDTTILYIRVQEQKFWFYILIEKGISVNAFSPVPDYWDKYGKDLNFWLGSCHELCKYIDADHDKLFNYHKVWSDKTKKAYEYDRYTYGDWRQVSDLLNALELPFIGEESCAKPVYISKFSYEIKNVYENDLAVNNWKLVSSIRESHGIDITKKYNTNNIKRLDLSKMRYLKSLTERPMLTEGDFSPIGDMINLKDLNLSNNFINDFSFIKKLKNIERLNLSYTGFEDASVLIGLDKLKSLNISYNSLIVNINTLEKLTNLKTITIDKSSLNSYNIEERLPNLRIKTIQSKIFSPVWFESKYYKEAEAEKAKNEYLAENVNDNTTKKDNIIKKFFPSYYKNNYMGIQHFEGIVKDFKKLKCSSTLITLIAKNGSSSKNINRLKKFVKLNTLSIERMNIKDISFTKNMPFLEKLFISFNNIEDISPIKGHQNIKQLYIAGNPISDISIINTLPSLSYIVADNKQVPDQRTLDAISKNIHVLVVKESYMGNIVKVAERKA